MEQEAQILALIKSTLDTHPEALQKKFLSSKRKIVFDSENFRLDGAVENETYNWVELTVKNPPEQLGANSTLAIQFRADSPRPHIVIIPDQTHQDLYEKYADTPGAEVDFEVYISLQAEHHDYPLYLDVIRNSIG